MQRGSPGRRRTLRASSPETELEQLEAAAAAAPTACAAQQTDPAAAGPHDSWRWRLAVAPGLHGHHLGSQTCGSGRGASEDQSHVALEMGTFDGIAIWRNKMCAAETFADGYVCMCNLTPPDCHELLASTFVGEPIGTDKHQPTGWLESVFPRVKRVTVFRHDDRGGNARKIGEAELLAINWEKRGRDWLWCLCRSTALLHSKFFVFRAKHGVRVVVSGNNLMAQWTADRDCLWVQDFPLRDAGAEGAKAEEVGGGGGGFGERLARFVTALGACKDRDDHQQEVHERIASVLEGVDFSRAKAFLVESLPLPAALETRSGAPLQGWQRLAEAVREARSAAGLVGPRAADDRVYFMAGSFGDCQPDFVQQMVGAIHGRDARIARPLCWSEVSAARCLWPSRGTAKEMNPLGVVASLRAIPMEVWRTIPPDAKNRLFFDARPRERWLQPFDAICRKRSKPIAHAKVIFSRFEHEAAGAGGGLIYVGSHNFSEAAWGIRGNAPKNVELGVVVCTSDSAMARGWEERLPALLPTEDEQALSARDRHYIPVSAPPHVREKAQTDLGTAIRWLDDYLERDEYNEAGVKRGRRDLSPDRTDGSGQGQSRRTGDEIAVGKVGALGGEPAAEPLQAELREVGEQGGTSPRAGSDVQAIVISDGEEDGDSRDAILISSDGE